MSTDLTIFNSKNVQLPDHLREVFAEEESNIKPSESLPALTIRGSKWRLKIGDEEKVLTKKVDGEDMPVPIIKVVVLAVNQKRSRIYYEGAFVEGENKTPTCWSTDGEKPDTSVPQPCAKTCASCEFSVKGSKITENGKETTACQALKRLAVIPVQRLDMEPLLLKVPQTSLWDKDNKEAEAQNYYAWDQYVKFLHNRGVPHTAALVTKMKFDPHTAYPKILFGADRWLSAEELAQVRMLMKDERVENIIHGQQNLSAPAKAEEAPEDEDDEGAFEQEEPAKPVKPAAKPAKPAKAAKAATKPAVVEEEDDDGFGEPEPVKPAKPAKAAPKKPVVEEDDDDGFEDVEEKPAKPAKAATKAATKPQVKEEDDDFASGFDDDDEEETPAKPAKAAAKPSKPAKPWTKAAAKAPDNNEDLGGGTGNEDLDSLLNEWEVDD